MADTGLPKLYQLHRIDARLRELKAHAAALDTGQKAANRLKDLLEEHKLELDLAKNLSAEQKDLELKQAGLKDKRQKFDKQLFSGSVTSSREVENIQKEIAMLKAAEDKIDDRLFELMEELPPALDAAKTIETQAAVLRAEVAKKKEAAIAEHAALKKEYAELYARRPKVAANVAPNLLEQYEPLLAKYGLGMAVITPKESCGECGINLATRIIELIKEDRLQQCPQCRRILFSPIPE